MRTISSALETAIAENNRKPRVKVDVTWTDPFVGSGNTTSATDQNNACGVASAVQEDYLDQLCDTEVTPSHKYIVNDGTWMNDGTFWWAPGTVTEVANNQIGWYSEEVSDSSGDFATAPTATVDFGEDRAVQRIRVVGDSILGQYPVDFTVYVYDSGDSLLDSDAVTGNASVEYVSDFSSSSITDARYIVLEIDSWSGSGTVSKIVEFFGVITDTFYGNDIVSLDVLEEIEADDSTSPFGTASINELNIEFQNIELTRENGDVVEDPFFPDNSASYLNNSITPNVRFDVYLGFVIAGGSTEYVSMGTFWSTEWSVSETDFSASVTARDRLEILRNNEFRLDAVLEDYNLYEIAEEILNHALINIPLGDLTWSLSTDLQDYDVPYAWFGTVTYFEALRKIAQAVAGRLYVNRDDEIVIEAFTADQESGSDDVTITKDDYFKQDRPINHSDIKNYIEVSNCVFAPESEAGDVYTTEDIDVGAGDTTVTTTVEWGDDALIEDDFDWTITDEDSITMSKVSETFYAWGAVLIAEKLTGSVGTFKINITGRKLVLTSVNTETSYDEDSIRLYQKRVLSLDQNFMIQSSTVASDIADALLASLKDPRRDVQLTFDLSANPAIEIGDIADIEVYSKDSVYDEFRIIRQQFKYDGAIGCSMTGRKTIDYGS